MSAKILFDMVLHFMGVEYDAILMDSEMYSLICLITNATFMGLGATQRVLGDKMDIKVELS